MASQGKGVTISSMCTVFAESEVISLIGKGTSREDIAYGVVESVAVKVAQLISQLGGNHYFLTGGLCDRGGVVVRGIKKSFQRINHREILREHHKYQEEL